MKKTIFLIMILSLVISCKNETRETQTSKNEKQMTEKTITLSGKKLEYNYGEYMYQLDFKSDKTLHWKCIKGDEIGKEADETYFTQRLNNNTFFVSWIEADGLGVSQVINLKDNTIKCFLKIEKEIVPLSGTIREL